MLVDYKDSTSISDKTLFYLLNSAFFFDLINDDQKTAATVSELYKIIYSVEK